MINKSYNIKQQEEFNGSSGANKGKKGNIVILTGP